MKVLVTGGTGFIGRHLVDRLLQRGDQVRCLTRGGSDPELESRGVEMICGDVTDRDSLRGSACAMDMAYHLASVGHVGANTSSSYGRFHNVNVVGLRNLIDELCESGRSCKLVHFSSTAAMGLIEGIASEESVCCPETPYQQSKYEAEQVLRQKCAECGSPVVILRPSMVYGPGDRNTDFLSMCRMVKKGIFPVSSSSKGLTPLVYVDDVVQAALLAGEHGRVGETYVITSDRSYSLRELVGAISETLGVDRGGVVLPNWVMSAAAVACEAWARISGVPPALTRKRLKSILTDRSFDISKAMSDLGYQPQVPLREGVIRTVEWYKSVGYL